MKKINITEQHISPIKLEKQRQKAYKMTTLSKKVPIIAFFLFMIIPTIKLIALLTASAEIRENIKSYLLYYLVHDAFMALIGAVLVFLVLFILSQKAYNLFNSNFKNKYILDTLKELSDFENLSYNAPMSYSFEEIKEAAIIPPGTKNFFISNDNLTGSFKNINFRSGSIMTSESNANHQRLLFSGQVIEFSYFDKSKISDGRVQVFSNKSLAFYQKLYDKSNEELMHDGKLGYKIETEDTDFNSRFCVYSDNEHNAFYILTPNVLENIKAMAETAEDNLYIVFNREKLFVALNSWQNPFDVYLDVSIEEQKTYFKKSTALLQNAVSILIK